MSQSFVQIYVHIVFHTKDNVKFIKDDIENELFSYIGGILKNYKSIPLQIGGTSDHVHILCTLPKTFTLADIIEEIKKSSSKWIIISPTTGLIIIESSGVGLRPTLTCVRPTAFKFANMKKVWRS